MEFEVLGPLRVRAGGQPAALTAMMPRTLLGILLTRANTSVPADVLVDALWAGQRDPRAAKRLQLHVHRLRRALGDPARIRFEHGGYALRLHPGELDAHRFETMIAEGTSNGDPARAVQLLRAALGLWRGDPFGGVADVALVRAEIDRLTERQLGGLEELYCAELGCGRTGAIVPELSALAARYPLRERLQGLLMNALSRAGRRAEALEVYHRTRAALVDDLGLEPGPELQRLVHAILIGDPTLEEFHTVFPAGNRAGPSTHRAAPGFPPGSSGPVVVKSTQTASPDGNGIARNQPFPGTILRREDDLPSTGYQDFLTHAERFRPLGPVSSAGPISSISPISSADAAGLPRPARRQQRPTH